jgi:two-component system sensor histidine kinase RpfC
MSDTPFALIHIANGPLTVVDSARIRSIRETCVLESPTTSRLIANAIHAAIANSSRDVADVVDLGRLVKQERRHLNILVADDNQTNQTIIAQLLTSAGHSVTVASDGEEALDMYERERPDVALLDFNMPHRNGLEVVRAIRVIEPPGVRMPTIILSASVTIEARTRAMESGADDFFGKPFDAAALIDRIDKLAVHIASRGR